MTLTPKVYFLTILEAEVQDRVLAGFILSETSLFELQKADCPLIVSSHGLSIVSGRRGSHRWCVPFLRRTPVLSGQGPTLMNLFNHYNLHNQLYLQIGSRGELGCQHTNLGEGTNEPKTLNIYSIFSLPLGFLEEMLEESKVAGVL